MTSAGTVAFQSSLGELLTQFIAEKRACGYRYREESRALRAFDAYLHKVGHESMDLPRDVVECWTCRAANETPRNHEHRQRLVQQFGRFLASRGCTVYLPDTRGRARARASFVPYIFEGGLSVIHYGAVGRIRFSGVVPAGRGGIVIHPRPG